MPSLKKLNPSHRRDVRVLMKTSSSGSNRNPFSWRSNKTATSQHDQLIIGGDDVRVVSCSKRHADDTSQPPVSFHPSFALRWPLTSPLDPAINLELDRTSSVAQKRAPRENNKEPRTERKRREGAAWRRRDEGRKREIKRMARKGSETVGCAEVA